MAALSNTPLNRRNSAVDVGAHVGLWSRILAGHFRTVHAFEPLAAHLECLHKNVGGLPNVLVYGNFALGSIPHSRGLFRVTENSGNTRLSGLAEEGVVDQPVTVYRFDDLWEQGNNPIDLMKIDVEGYELEVVRGAEQSIKRNKPTMVVEQKAGNAEVFGFRTGEVIDLLQSWGANIAWCRSGDYCLTWS